MKNPEVARLLYDIADLLEMQDVQFKPRAYRRAARNIEALSEPIEDIHGRGELRDIEGVGEAIADKVAEYLETGRLAYHEELRQQAPVDLEAMTAVEGLGPKRVKQLYDALGVTTLDELEAAAKEGRIAEVEGFGETTQQNILDRIDAARRVQERTLYGAAVPIVEDLLSMLDESGAFGRLEAVGSYRRRLPTVGDIDILATAPDPTAAAEAFCALPDVADVLAQGETRSSVVLGSGLQVDLRVIDEDSRGAALMYFTGSKEHNVAMRGRAKARAWKLNEYGLFEDDPDDAVVDAATEEAVFEALDLPWIPPELREDLGEIDAAERGELPDLVTVGDVRGDLQMHTTWSDGQRSVEEMADKAAELGYDYILITDHGPSLRVAGGPELDELDDYMAEIDAVDDAHEVTVLKGIEANITKEGALDVPDDVCDALDLVVVALHDRVADADDATGRIVKALEDHPADILAHPTNRRLGEREGNPLEMDRIVEACRANEVAVEINCQPDRLDLGWREVHRHRGEVKFTLGTDAHSPTQMEHMEFGVSQARKGWLEPGDVLNTMALDELRKHVGR